MGQINQEPSMEDILASIKRIIAEDSEAVGARAPRLRREAMTAVASSPLVTKTRVIAPATPDEDDEPETQETVAEIEAAEAPDPSHDVLELTSPMPNDNALADAPEIPAALATAPIGLSALTSSSAAEASRNAFAALSQMQVRVETGQENTLEGLVADMLRPMLREWLDRELPTLVERMVSAEISRLSGRG
jgi:uncharacterized protein